MSWGLQLTKAHVGWLHLVIVYGRVLHQLRMLLPDSTLGLALFSTALRPDRTSSTVTPMRWMSN